MKRLLYLIGRHLIRVNYLTHATDGESEREKLVRHELLVQLQEARQEVGRLQGRLAVAIAGARTN